MAPRSPSDHELREALAYAATRRFFTDTNSRFLVILADALEAAETRIEKALESLNENEDPDTVVIAILSDALSDVKEEEK